MEATRESRNTRRWTLATLAVIAGYVIFITCLGRYATVDEAFFKAPGLHWATSCRFAAPELTGVEFLSGVTPTIDEIWFVHPPGYPFLFGLFVKVFGFGPTQCVLFDALIHGCLAFLAFLTTRRLGETLPDWCAFAVAVAVLPLAEFGRPDELGTCLGMSSLLLLLQQPASRWFVVISGVVLGLSAATFLGPAIMLGIIGLCVIFENRGTPRAFVDALTWAAVAVMVLTLAVAPILIACPQAPAQFLAHVTAHFGSGSFLVGFFTHWEYEQFHRSITLACASVAALGLVAMPWPRWRRLWLGPALGILFVAVLVPAKMYYLWFIGPWMMAAAALTWYAIVPALHPLVMRGAILWVLGLYAVACSSFIRNTVAMLALPESQRFGANAEIVRALIPPSGRVVTDQFWWLLAEDRQVFDRYFSRVRPEQVDYVVVIGAGDPGLLSDVPALPTGSLAAEFETIHNNIRTSPLTLFGRPLPQSAPGFGTLVLQNASRRDKGNQP